jgi:arylsulfatase A-like enzyme
MAKRKTPRKTAGGARSAPGSPVPAQTISPVASAGLAAAAVTWLVVALVDVTFSALFSGAALQAEALPIGARISIAAYGVAVLTAVVSVVAGLVWLLRRIAPPGAPRAVQAVVAAVTGVVIWIAIFFYGASWALFWNTGVFLDRQAFAFIAPNPVQVFHWVYPPLAAAVIGITVAAAIAFGYWIPRRLRRSSAEVQRRLVRSAAVAAAACVIVALFGALTYGAGGGGPDQPKTDYAIARDDHAGPAAHALADVIRARPADDTAAAAAGTVTSTDGSTVVRRPIISMPEYLARIAPSAVKRRNVLMVQIESLRSDQLRIYGGTRDVMPAVDALAREARVFTNAYVQASHSNYTDLVPLSSQYPLRSAEMYEYPPNPTYPRVLIYDVLKALGYKTAIFSSQNERWGGMINYHRPSSLDRFFHAETSTGPTSTQEGDLGFAEWVKETKGAGSVDDRYTVQEAMKWLDTVGPGDPFFLHMNLQSSHVPYVVPDDFPHRFSPKKLDFAILWAKFPIEKIDIVKGRYADSLLYEDTQIARLFEYLKSRGLWDNTVVVIGGDNGEAFYEHGFASHASSLFNEVMKVPMIIRAPDLEPGLDPRPAMFLDIPPSVFGLLGLPPHPGFQGISLFDPNPDPDRSIYMIVQTPAAFQSAIVRSGYKLLYSEWDGRNFLYDLVNDPAETPTKNLAASRPDLLEDLTRRLRLWRREQLSYYADVSRQSREYPPVITD